MACETETAIVSLAPTGNRSTKSIRTHAIRVDVNTSYDANNSQIR
jgi:hypothetical protein